MNMVGCLGNLFQQVVKLVCSVRIDRNVAPVEQGRLVAVGQKCNQRLVVGWDGTCILREFSCLRTFHDAFIGMPGDNPLFPVVLPEEEIEQKPDAGGKQQYDYPRNGFQRISIFRDDDQHQSQNGDAV